jgi:hypothetical protein
MRNTQKFDPPRVPLARRGGFLEPFFPFPSKLVWDLALPGTERRVEEARVLGLEDMENFL